MRARQQELAETPVGVQSRDGDCMVHAECMYVRTITILLSCEAQIRYGLGFVNALILVVGVGR